MNDLAAEAIAEFRADIAKGKAAILEAERQLHIELDSALFDGYRFPVPLPCGCKVRLERVEDEGDWWTERRWSLCERHEALGCEP